MQDGEQLVRWTRTGEDPRVIKHCLLSINQPCHPARQRPNAKLGLINRRKDKQQLLFYSENKTWCSALISFGVSTSQSTLALFPRMIVPLDFAVMSSENMKPVAVGADVLDERGFCGSSFLCSSAVHSAPHRAWGCSFCVVFFSRSFEEVGLNLRSGNSSDMFQFLISPKL